MTNVNSHNMVISQHRSYNSFEQLRENLAESGATVIVRFPSSIPDNILAELEKGEAKVETGCGCSSYKVDYGQKGIEFTIKAPDVKYLLTKDSDHYLKRVTPYIVTALGDKIQYDIKFFVRNPFKDV